MYLSEINKDDIVYIDGLVRARVDGFYGSLIMCDINEFAQPWFAKTQNSKYFGKVFSITLLPCHPGNLTKTQK